MLFGYDHDRVLKLMHLMKNIFRCRIAITGITEILHYVKYPPVMSYILKAFLPTNLLLSPQANWHPLEFMT